MTMPVPTPPVQTIDLPAPGYPMVTRVISDPLFPPEAPAPAPPPAPGAPVPAPVAAPPAEPLTWVVSHAHPLVPQMKVVRMFVEALGIAVYSVALDGTTGMRNLIPTGRTRFVEEAMPLEVFIDELAIAESDADAPDDEEDEPPEAPAQDSSPQEASTGPKAVPTPDNTAAAEPSSDEQSDAP